jgi:hypothetical protein
LENDVDKRGHVDPGINAAFSGDEHFLRLRDDGLGPGKKSFTKV